MMHECGAHFHLLVVAARCLLGVVACLRGLVYCNVISVRSLVKMARIAHFAVGCRD